MSCQALNEVCDASCRESAATMFVDPSTGFLVIVDGNSTGKGKSRDVACGHFVPGAWAMGSGALESEPLAESATGLCYSWFHVHHNLLHVGSLAFPVKSSLPSQLEAFSGYCKFSQSASHPVPYSKEWIKIADGID